VPTGRSKDGKYEPHISKKRPYCVTVRLSEDEMEALDKIAKFYEVDSLAEAIRLTIMDLAEYITLEEAS
jgi:hypothetical protein